MNESTKMTINILSTTYFILLIGLASTGKVEFTNCGSLWVVVSVSIQPCDKVPCEFRSNQYYELEIPFQPASSSQGLTASLVWKSGNSSVTILDRNACEGLSTGCPYNGGLLNNYKVALIFPDEMFEPEPLGPDGRLECKLKNASGSVEACIAIPGTLVD